MTIPNKKSNFNPLKPMAKIVQNTSSLNHEEAMNFFMKSEQCHGFELQEYFCFGEVLKFVRDAIGNTPFEDYLNNEISPGTLSDVNLGILLNKDGRYAATLFNPIHSVII